jgi:hypothetical protein
VDAYRIAVARLSEHVALPADLMDLDRSQGLADNPPGMNSVQMSRWAKVNLDQWAPSADTLYLDADTHVLSDAIMVGFDILDDGWDMVITPSDKQDDQWLWHCDEHDREATRNEVGPSTQLQAGVFWFRKSERVAEFFRAWREEWLRFKGQDQGALLRALERCPIRVWLLGYPFNGGAVVAHNYGMAREN